MNQYTQSIFERAKNYIRQHGLIYTLWYTLQKVFAPIFHIYYNNIRKPGTFTIRGKIYTYIHHKYRTTWFNERAIEIPYFLEIIKGKDPTTILEIGNTLGHYVNLTHEVVDKYEYGRNVINRDIREFRTNKKYDLIISISTLEHIDTNIFSDYDTLFDNLMGMLSPSGKLIFSVPRGFNPFIDHYLSFKLQVNNHITMKRIDICNNWIEDNDLEIDTLYGHPYPCANKLDIYEINNGETECMKTKRHY